MTEDKDIKLQKPEEESRFQPPYQKKYDNIKSLLRAAFRQLDRVNSVIESMEQDDKKTYYQSIPGTEGYFDGVYLIADDGRKTEVPGNYAAKSRLVYGDRLKVFSESGKQIFKQITKAERKKIEGVLGKKEGSWYILAKEGSYKISDVAAEFNKAELNDKASAYIPAGNTNVPYAALDQVQKLGVSGEVSLKAAPKKEIEKAPVKSERRSVKPKAKPAAKKVTKAKEEPKVEEKVQKEFVDNLLEDDDLR